jgi:glucosamine-6-phosphate deaminase
MEITVSPNKEELGRRSAEQASALIREAITQKGRASIIVATGASQFEFLQHLTSDRRIDWSKMAVFHLDEYVGISDTHIASFRRYLRERLIQQIPCPLAAFHEVNASNDPYQECERLGTLIAKETIDVCCMGIGENGHIAFNDPPADFDTEQPYLVVNLDQGCRQQQVNEGWFPTLADVPTQAISMSVKQILKSRALINSVPGERKARAVKNALEDDISPACPASILRTHPACYLNLDTDSAQLLTP